MKRWVYGYEVIDGDPAALATTLRERVRDLLRAVTDTPEARVEVDGSFPLRLGADLGATSATKDVKASTGVATEVRGRTRIPLSWHADPGRHAFPSFEGTIELEPLSSRHAQLTVVGSYTVPLGVVGLAFDGLGLGTVAQGTIAALAQGLGERLEALMTAGAPSPAEPTDTSRLTLRVRDVMTPDPMVLEESLSLRTAALLLVYRNVQGAPVVSADGDLVGVLSEQDLLEKEAAFGPLVGRDAKDRERRRQAVSVGEACTRPARVTVPDASLRDTARAMIDHGTARLVVVDDSRVAGIVTRHDVIKALLRSDAELQAAVDVLLATLAERDLRATVIWGEVSLEGVASTRSNLAHVTRMLTEIDGILTVHGEPACKRDDVTESVYGLRAG